MTKKLALILFAGCMTAAGQTNLTLSFANNQHGLIIGERKAAAFNTSPTSLQKSAITGLHPWTSSENRTAIWDMLRRINNQIHALAPTLITLLSIGVYHYPDVPEQMQRYVRPPVAGRFLIGEFRDNSNRPYFMVVNKDLKNSFQFQMDLKQEAVKLIRVSRTLGKK